jgi:ribosomal protein S18 acetylase RimI-like enzyme
VRCFVEPSPAGGYFVRLRGEAAPLSRHDTEEEAEAAAAAYERGLAREDTLEHVLLTDGSEVVIRPAEGADHVDHEAIGAADSVTREAIGLARYDRDNERPHIATASVTVDEAWRGRGLDERLTRALTARARENGIRIFVVDGVERPLS